MRDAVRELLDPEVVLETEQQLQRLAPDRRARNAEETADLLHALGDLSTAEAAQRAVRMAIAGKVTAVTGEDVELSPTALCVHSDPAGAVELASAVANAVRANDIPMIPIR